MATPMIGIDGAGEVPWFALVLTALAVGLGLVTVLRGRRLRAERGQKESAEEKALTEHHRPRWSVDPRSFSPTPVQWGIAVAAPFALCSGTPWHELRYTDVEVPRGALEQGWGIHTRQELLGQLYWLYTEGHRERFYRERRDWGGASSVQANKIETELSAGAQRSEEAAEALWRFRRVRADDRSIRTVDFLAWDFVRFAMIVRGSDLGYLTEEEAEDTLAMVTEDLRIAYSGWVELGEQFRLGRWYWHSKAGAAEAETDRHDLSRQRALIGPEGPWQAVPWDLEVPAPRGLFVDALVAETEVRPQPFSKLQTATPQMQRIDAEVRRRVNG